MDPSTLGPLQRGSASLVSGRIDTTSPFSGLRVIEDGADIADAIKNKDWLSGSLAGVALVTDAFAMLMDPIGQAVGMGVGWILDHISPLKEWLNELTGDSGAVAGAAATWGNIGNYLDTTSQQLTADLQRSLGSMTSQTIDQARKVLTDTAQHIGVASETAHAVGTGLQVASTIVQIVHDMVRDAIGDIVGSAVSALIQLGATLGLAVPKVIADVAAKCARWATKISKYMKDLVRSIAKLARLNEAASAVMNRLRKGMDKVCDKFGTPHKSGAAGAPPPLADDVPPPGTIFEKSMADIPVNPSQWSIHSIAQGNAPDCWVISSILAIAHKRPDLLEGLVKKLPDGTIEIKLPKDPSIIVENTLPYRVGVDGTPYPEYSSIPPGVETATAGLFLERAFAEQVGGYEKLAPNHPDRALERLTGIESIGYTPKSFTPEKIREVAGSPHPVIVATTPFESMEIRELASQYNLVGGHAYAVDRVTENGEILLHNPWQVEHPTPIPPHLFNELFGGIYSFRKAFT